MSRPQLSDAEWEFISPFLPVGVAEHAAVYQAIPDGDPEAAADAATVHLDRTLEDYRREIQRRVFG